MLCRTSTIEHGASGVAMTTPLLIPSFSSKGFARIQENGRSEVRDIFDATNGFIKEVFLISAYDIFYGHVPQPQEMECTPELVVVDSGGYEVVSASDRPSSKILCSGDSPWTLERLESVYNEWPDDIPAILVSFDHPDVRKPFLEQIADAQMLFRARQQHLKLFLLKPEAKEHATLFRTIESAEEKVGELGIFDIVGVTEDELGNSAVERMLQIARLRLAMDNAGVDSPLHVFGALDPLSMCLYFIAGAEVFDGLKWLRYAYKDDLRICSHSLDDGCEQLQVLRKKNLHALQSIQNRLIEFEATRDFDKFEPHATLLSDAYDHLKAQLQRRP